MPGLILRVNKKDNVATALTKLTIGDSVKLENEDLINEVELSQPIPFGHKIATRDIECGESIIKFGEKIGLASSNIKTGEHVHLHNVEGFRGRGDKE